MVAFLGYMLVAYQRKIRQQLKADEREAKRSQRKEELEEERK